MCASATCFAELAREKVKLLLDFFSRGDLFLVKTLAQMLQVVYLCGRDGGGVRSVPSRLLFIV